MNLSAIFALLRELACNPVADDIKPKVWNTSVNSRV